MNKRFVSCYTSTLGCAALVLGSAAMTASQARADDYRLSGPYTHDNLSIYLIHAQKHKAAGQYLTLQQALDQKKVVVYETSSVNELAIENLSSEDVYIQSGDIVKGGKQDRVIPDDFILPTASGKVPIPAFCVEHGRWSRRGSEAADRFAASTQALPAKSLKLAARNDYNQAEVWNEVAKTQQKFAASLGAAAPPPTASPSSMQLTIENPQVVNAADAYLRSLSKIVDGKPDVVGFAFAINGKMNSADMYASNQLFQAMWPKLVRASALEAVAERGASASTAPVPAAAVRTVLLEAAKGRESSKPVSGRIVDVKKDAGSVILFESRDRQQGDWVHRSYVVK
jgi:hypothetical protein